MAAPLINTRYEVLETFSQEDASPFVVSKARDVTDNRIVTLQVLPAGSADVSAVRTAASAAQSLEHPNITRVFDHGAGAEAGDEYIVSEHVRGITLAERIRRVAPFSLAVAVDLAISISEALSYAHRSDVVHGDLRPQDVLLSPEGQVKVANFAYARAALPQRGEPSDVEDLLAFGSLLYQMLTGMVPALENSRPPAPRAVNAGVPIALDGIVQKCLHPDLSQRYETAAALLLDLQAVRDALRSGRSLAWSPLTEKRSPRPASSEAAVIPSSDPSMSHPTNSPSGRTGRPTPLAAAAEELSNERTLPPVRERSSPFTKIVAAAFVVAVLGVIALTWYISKFLQIPNDVLVPNLVGKTFDDAKRVAQQQHFVLIEAGSDYSVKWPENQIYQQDPLPGRTIKAGKEIDVRRSLGPRLLTVPNLIGTTRERALRDLQDTGLHLGAINEDYSEAVPKGIVLNQTPEKASQVARDGTVSLTISKGRQPPDAPGDADADAVSTNTIVIHWSAAARADNYNVYRVLDGNSTPVAQGIKDTRFTDKGLTPDTSYTYSVTAVNASGDSGPGEPIIVSTLAKVVAPPTMPGDVSVVSPPESDPSLPPDTEPADETSKTSGRMRQFTIGFRVPRHPRRSRHIQFEVQDVTGTNLVYDENHQPGDEISEPIQAFGNKIIFRIFIDGSLAKQQTL